MKTPYHVYAAVVVLAILMKTSVPALSALPESSVLTIKIENVSPQGGALQIALYDEEGYAGHDQPPIAKLVVDAKAPETVARIPNIRPGVYAIKMFQDIHRTGSFATSAMGVPEEPFGFSNDARPFLDQPEFERAKFTIADGGSSIVVHLQSL